MSWVSPPHQEATSFLNSKVPSAEAWLLTSCLASFPRASAGAEVAVLGRAALEEAGVLPGALPLPPHQSPGTSAPLRDAGSGASCPTRWGETLGPELGSGEGR